MRFQWKTIFGFAAAAIAAVMGRNLIVNEPAVPPGRLPDVTAMKAILQVDPDMSPTSGKTFEINGEPYLLRVEKTDPSNPAGDDCQRITIWPDRPETPLHESRKSKPLGPVFEKIICG
jgi:hypothetical protein